MFAFKTMTDYILKNLKLTLLKLFLMWLCYVFTKTVFLKMIKKKKPLVYAVKIQKSFIIKCEK